MTIIVGIICKNGIVVACDSQTTTENVKRPDADKITALKLADKSILVAQSGDCALAAKAVEVLGKDFTGISFEDYRQPADAAQQAVAQVKRELVQLNNWEDRRDLETAYLSSNPFSLMLAYYFDKIPYLYVLASVPGFASREYKFAAIGCGATVGEFILSRSGAWELTPEKALAVAIYTVEEVKKVDAFCGGPTKAAFIGPNKLLISGNESTPIIKSAVKALEEYEPELRQNWEELIEKMTAKIAHVYKREKK